MNPHNPSYPIWQALASAHIPNQRESALFAIAMLRLQATLAMPEMAAATPADMVIGMIAGLETMQQRASPRSLVQIGLLAASAVQQIIYALRTKNHAAADVLEGAAHCDHGEALVLISMLREEIEHECPNVAPLMDTIDTTVQYYQLVTQGSVQGQLPARHKELQKLFGVHTSHTGGEIVIDDT